MTIADHQQFPVFSQTSSLTPMYINLGLTLAFTVLNGVAYFRFDKYKQKRT